MLSFKASKRYQRSRFLISNKLREIKTDKKSPELYVKLIWLSSEVYQLLLINAHSGFHFIAKLKKKVIQLKLEFDPRRLHKTYFMTVVDVVGCVGPKISQVSGLPSISKESFKERLSF